MAVTREKAKGRKGSSKVCLIPHFVMDHPDYINLSGFGLKLLMELAKQYNGYSNNGDLTAAWQVMCERGFNSKATLAKALRELLQKQLIVCTRHGRFINPGKRCALYALSWKPIDECAGKGLDVGPTQKPFRSFTAEIIKMPGTDSVPTRPRFCTERGGKHG